MANATLIGGRRYLAAKPDASEVMDAMAMEFLSAGDHRQARYLAARSLAIRPDGVLARFVLCMAAIADADEVAARRLSRQMICLEPGNDRALYCAIWHPPVLSSNRDL